ncbi:MAG: hypothetical protein HWD62_06250 [Cyclobacteriaceae bacterium]|nr:MAG: hypothetical protein HWD62_06250 [Cyclobacteriaceae bacterium]
MRERERIQRFPVDSAVLTSLRYRIDSVAFEEAKQVNNELVYIRYLSKYRVHGKRSKPLNCAMK